MPTDNLKVKKPIDLDVLKPESDLLPKDDDILADTPDTSEDAIDDDDEDDDDETEELDEEEEDQEMADEPVSNGGTSADGNNKSI